MDYYVFKNNQQVGPLALTDVHARLQRGEFTYADLAWRAGMANWTPLQVILGGALPSAMPHALSPIFHPNTGPLQAPTGLRIVTAIVVFFAAFVVIFCVSYIGVCMIGGFISGFEAGLNHETGTGGQAGADFVRHSLGMIMGGCALFSLAASPIVAYFMAFSEIFPWCRKR